MTYLQIGLWISSPFQRRWRLNEAVRWGWPSRTGVLTRRRHPTPGMCTHRAKATGELGEKEVVGHRGSVSARNPHCRHLDLRLAASRAARSAFLCVATSRPARCVMTALAYTGITLDFWQKPETPFSIEELNKGCEPGSVFTDRQGSWVKHKIPT